MVTLITIPALNKMSNPDLLKSVFFAVSIDVILLLACIHY